MAVSQTQMCQHFMICMKRVWSNVMYIKTGLYFKELKLAIYMAKGFMASLNAQSVQDNEKKKVLLVLNKFEINWLRNVHRVVRN